MAGNTEAEVAFHNQRSASNTLGVSTVAFLCPVNEYG